jgi:hypothetical protein
MCFQGGFIEWTWNFGWIIIPITLAAAIGRQSNQFGILLSAGLSLQFAGIPNRSLPKVGPFQSIQAWCNYYRRSTQPQIF